MGGSQKPIGKVDPPIWQVPKKCSPMQLFGCVSASMNAQALSDTYFTNREILKYWNFHRMDPNAGDIQPYILLKKFNYHVKK